MPEEKKDIWKTLLSTLWDGTKVYIVNGNYVRDTHSADFTEGGHGFVYDWISKTEIWIEEMIDVSDEADNAAHEIFEYMLMKYVKKGYEDAHEIALNVESVLRKFDKKIEIKAKVPKEGGEPAEEEVPAEEEEDVEESHNSVLVCRIYEELKGIYDLLPAKKFYKKDTPGYVVLRNGSVEFHGSKEECDKIISDAKKRGQKVNEELSYEDPSRKQLPVIVDTMRNFLGVRGIPKWFKYLSFREGTSNKFHYFGVFLKDKGFVASNAYGRIGAIPKVVEIGSGDNYGEVLKIATKKYGEKLKKGYQDITSEIIK